MKKLPVYKLFINEEEDDTIVNMISIVEDPAIEIMYLAFAKETLVEQKFTVQDESKRYLLGPLMVPDTPIYRVNKDEMGNVTEEYYVVMDCDTIENAVKKFAKNRFNSNINANHSIGIKGGTLIESWIVTDPKNDKANAYGFKDLKKGTWMGVVYLEQEAWDSYIKNGDLKFGGFSIEGNFLRSNEPIAEEFSKDIDKDLMELAGIVYDFLNENNNKE